MGKPDPPVAINRVPINAKPTRAERWGTNLGFGRSNADAKIREESRLKATEANTRKNKILTIKQRKFAAEYIADPNRNAIQAAMRAGYTRSSATSIVNDLLRHPQIKALIEAEDKRIFDKLQITAENVLKETAAIAFSNIMDYITIDEDGKIEIDLEKASPHQTSAIQECIVDYTGKRQKVRIKLNDKLQALEKLGRYLKIFDTSPQTTTTVNIAILDKIVNGEMTIDDLPRLSEPSEPKE